MAGLGPPPKPDDERARANPTIAMTRLPAAGRTGRAPAWPLEPDIVMTTKRDLAKAKVRQLRDQRDDAVEAGNASKTAAVERRLDVALERLTILEAQLRHQRKLEAELWLGLWKTPQSVQWERLAWTREVAQYVRHKVLGELGVLDEAKEARQWSDRLGLTPMALLRLRWEIAPVDAGGHRPAARPPARARYEGLRVVASGQA